MDTLASNNDYETKGGFEEDDMSSKIPAPLLFEVNELLSKERVLMELKLLDQQLEADEWKNKYTQLKGDIVDGIVAKHAEEYLEVLDEVGDLEGKQQETDELSNKHLASKEDLNAILMTRVDDNCADLSDLNLNGWIFNQLIKILFGVRSEYDQITVLDVRNANIGPTMLPMLLHALRNHRLLAIDLAKNDLNEEMFSAILETLRNRKQTPQYILMNGNTPFANHSQMYADVIHVLSSETWGLLLSLQDLLNNPKEVTEDILKKNAKKVKKDTSLTYRQLAKNPHRALQFLQTLHHKLTVNQKSEEEQLGLVKKEKKKTTKKADTLKIGKGGKLEERTVNGMQSFVVFGLTEHHLGKDTIEVLGETLQLMRSTLTDLDLSFSYMGYRGAQMIATVLRDPLTQLITVNLRANLFGESGGILIVEALKSNTTLTSLNLGSNFLGSKIAEDLCEIAICGKVMQYLDLSNNNVSATVIEKIEDSLLSAGSSFFPKFDDVSKQNDHIREILETPNLLYYQPHLSSQYCGVDKWKKLIEVNLSRPFLQQPRLLNLPVVLRCMMRLKPIEDFATMFQRLIISRKPRQNGNTLLDEPFLYLNCGVSIVLEVRILDKKKVISRVQRSLDDYDFECRNFHNCQPRPWIPVNFIVKDVPANAKLQLRMLARNNLGQLVWDTTCCLGVEIIMTNIATLPIQEDYFLGGDSLAGHRDEGREIADELQYMLEESYFPELQYDELKYHQILRCITWRWNACNRVRLKWQSKLNVAKVCKDGTEEDMYIYGNEDINGSIMNRTSDFRLCDIDENEFDKLRPRKFQLLQYEWAVSVHTKTGRRRIVKNIRCDGFPGSAIIRDQVDPWDPHLADKLLSHEEDEDAYGEMMNNPPISDPLLPWTWKSFEVEIDHLLPDDIIILSAKLLSDDPRDAADIVENCTVKARDFSAFMMVGNISYYSDDELNEIIPMYRDPLTVYQCYYTTEEVDEEREESNDNILDKWGKPMGYT